VLSPAQVACPRDPGGAIRPQSEHTDDREAAIDSTEDFSGQAKPQQEDIAGGEVSAVEEGGTVTEDH
jgi:hypothetical protein